MNKYRTYLSALLTAIEPMDSREVFDRRWALDWVGGEAPLFRGEVKHLPDPHLVVYAAPVDLVSRSVYLVDHRLSGLELPPGGHVDAGELLEGAVAREVVEELGVSPLFDLAVGKAPVFMTATQTRPVLTVPPHTDMTLWYAVRLPPDRPLAFGEPQVPGGRWYSFAQAQSLGPRRTDSELARFIAKLTVLV